MRFLVLAAFLTDVYHAFAATPAEWQSRSIYQVVTDRFARTDGSTTAPCNPGLGEYCGGSWKGLIDKLDYIQGMGFSAVWISPVTKQEQKVTADLSSYHGYWQTDLYEVNAAFGTTDDLKALSAALHARGMYLMLDVVVNHFAWAGNGTAVDYSTFNPFNRNDYFHPFKLLSPDDYSNSTAVQQDWLGDNVLSLPDVKTEDPKVAQILYSWIESLVSNYSADGLRIDTVLNVNPDFFPDFSKAAGVFCTGEVFDGDSASFCPLQKELDSMINFPIYFDLTRAFNSTSGNITELVTQMENVQQNCRDIHVLTTFSENHDLPRFASYTSDMSLAQNIITYNILADGIPIIYQGQEQHLNGSFNPINREAQWLTKYNTSAPLYSLITSLNQLRTHAFSAADTYGSYITNTIYQDEHTLVLRKGVNGSQVVTVLTNRGESSEDQTLSLKDTGFQAEEAAMEVLTCVEQKAEADGSLSVTIQKGRPRVFYPSAGLKGSTVCQKNEPPASSPSGKRSAAGGGIRTLARSSFTGFVGCVLVLWVPIIIWWI